MGLQCSLLSHDAHDPQPERTRFLASDLRLDRRIVTNQEFPFPIRKPEAEQSPQPTAMFTVD